MLQNTGVYSVFSLGVDLGGGDHIYIYIYIYIYILSIFPIIKKTLSKGHTFAARHSTKPGNRGGGGAASEKNNLSGIKRLFVAVRVGLAWM